VCVRMAYTCFQTPWWLLPLQKKLLMCINELHLMGGTNDLNTLPLKLFNILSINYPFLFQQKKISSLCMSHPWERSAAILDWFWGLLFYLLWIRESPPSIMVTRNPDWSFKDSKARDWLHKGKVLAPLVRPT